MGIIHEKFAVSLNDKEEKTLFWILIQFLPTSVKRGENKGMVCHFLLQGSQARDRTQVSSTGMLILYCWPTRETLQSMLNSVQFSRSVMSDSLWPHGLQHARLPCPSPNPWVCSNSCPLSRWCHPTISSSVFPFFSCLQSFPPSEAFPMSQFFAWGGQSIGASASRSVVSLNIQEAQWKVAKYDMDGNG